MQKSTFLLQQPTQLKQRIKRSKQKLFQLKNDINSQLLQKLRTLQNQVKRLQILNLSQSRIYDNKNLLKQFQKDEYEDMYECQDSQYQNIPDQNKQASFNPTKLEDIEEIVEYNLKKNKRYELSNLQNLQILRNVTTRNYSRIKKVQPSLVKQDKQKNPKQTNLNQQRSMGHQTANQTQFSPSDFIAKYQQSVSPSILQSQIYPILNRYLTSKSTLLSKIIQLNPEKRHNNSLLIPHQRVMLKQHLDMVRRITSDLEQKNQELQKELNSDFILIRNKWEESQRQIAKYNLLKHKI